MKTVMGMGVNDADYVVCERKPGGERVWCPFYRRWVQMLARCYNKPTLDRQPCYESSAVCEDWLLFSSFREWMEKQKWDGLYLDKDILGDDGVYSPENCAFVTRKANNFLRKTFKGDLIYSSIKMNMRGGYEVYHGRGRVGTFDSLDSAKQGLIERKVSVARRIGKGEPDARIRERFHTIVEQRLRESVL